MVGYALTTRHNCVVHRNANCPHIANKITVEVDERNRKRCRVCYRTEITCMICTDKLPSGWRGCKEHMLCVGCLRNHTLHELENPQWNGQIRCPCGEAAQQDLPPALRRLVNDRIRPASQGNTSNDPIHRIVESALTHRCPHCKAAFYDFTGCAAVVCRCGGNFCACCLAPLSNNQECHDHVRICRFNYRKDYWIDTQTMAHIMHDRRCLRAWEMIGNIARETQSLIFACGVALRVTHIDKTALIPHYMHAFLCIPSIFWWVLICLIYPWEACIGSAVFYTLQYCASKC